MGVELCGFYSASCCSFWDLYLPSSVLAHAGVPSFLLYAPLRSVSMWCSCFLRCIEFIDHFSCYFACTCRPGLVMEGVGSVAGSRVEIGFSVIFLSLILRIHHYFSRNTSLSFVMYVVYLLIKSLNTFLHQERPADCIFTAFEMLRLDWSMWSRGSVYQEQNTASKTILKWRIRT